MKFLNLKHLLPTITIIILLFSINGNAQIITTVIGNGNQGYSGDGGKAIFAELYQPTGITEDTSGNIYIACYTHIRKVTKYGIITTIAGNGADGYSGDGGAATSAALSSPYGIAVDLLGNVYFTDINYHVVRKIDNKGIITTVAGNGIQGYSGDGGLATSAELKIPYGVSVDAIGNLYIADTYNNCIRKVSINGIITTIVGNASAGFGKQGYSGDGGTAISAKLNEPYSCCFDKKGNMYISDVGNHIIREVNISGIINTVAGNGTYGYTGDGGLATSAELWLPTSLALDSLNNLYISDGASGVVRKVSANGIINTIAGNGLGGYNVDGGLATAARLSNPIGITFDKLGNLYICDAYNNVIREIVPTSSYTKIISFSPNTAITGDTVTIKGIAFTGATNVSFGDSIAKSFIVLNDTTIKAIVGNGSSGSVLVTAKYTDSLSGFNYVVEPKIFSFIPTTASVGTTVTILGYGFENVSKVAFGDSSATSFTVINDSTISAIVGNGASGSVSVITSGGTANLSGFTYAIVPTILYFTPNASCLDSTTNIFIAGSNFTGATTVSFGGKPAASFTVNSSNSITARLGSGSTGIVKVVTPKGTATSIDTFTIGKGFTAYAYVANWGSNSVSVINTTTNKITATITVGSNPNAVGVSPDGTRVYIANTNRTVSVISTVTNTVIATIPVGDYPMAVCVSPDGKKVYVANYFNDWTVNVIDATINKVVKTLNIGYGSTGIAMSPDGSKVYVATNYNPYSYLNIITVIGTSNDSILKTIPVGKWPYQVTTSPDGARVYVTNEIGNSLSVINSSTNTVIATVMVGKSPTNVCISPDGVRVYVVNSADNTVSIINTASNSVIATIPVGNSPNGISVSPDGTKVYVTNGNDNNVYIINTITNTVIANIAVGGGPYSGGNFIANVPTACSLQPPLPVVSSFKPANAGTGDMVSISGSGFTGATQVAFGNIQATSFTVVNDSTITAIVGSGTSGSVRVTTSIGIDSLVGFKYLTPFTITSFSPKAVCLGTSTTVFITGTNLIGATEVTVGSIPVDSFMVNSATSIIAYISKGTTGKLVVTCPNGKAISDSNFIFGEGYTAYAYISNGGDGSVSVINTVTNQVIKTIKVGGIPKGVSASIDGTKVYVSNWRDSTVDAISTVNNEVVEQFKVGYRPWGLCISPDGTKVYVANTGDNTVSIIDNTTSTILATIPVGGSPYSICVTTDNTKVYVSNFNANTVSVINVATQKVISTINVGQLPYGICISPDGSKIFVANSFDNSVSVINTATDKLITTIAIHSSDPTGISISPDGKNLYVVDEVNSLLTVVDVATYTVKATISLLGPSPKVTSIASQGVSVTPDGTKVYITNQGNNTVSVVNTNNNSVIANISVGSNPITIGNFIANVPTSCWPMPVTLTNIEAANKNGRVAVNWRTSTELNTSHFIVQHSTDGTSFTDIGFVKAIGYGENSYEFTDNKPPNGINNYRLQSVDKDGSSSYSKVVSVIYRDKQSFSIIPNPAIDYATISFNKTVDKATIAVYDMKGKQVIRQSLNGSTNTYKLNTQSLKSGLYMIKVSTGKGDYKEKLLINK